MADKPGTKTIKILLKLLAAPYRLRLKQLGAAVGLSDRGTITKHLDCIRAAGIVVKRDKHDRYAVIPQTGFKELNYLSPFSEADKNRMKELVGQLSTAEATSLINKLESLYNWQALGIEALRRPELEKLDAIEEAKRLKNQVTLVNYRSRNSNDERDRRVEPFGIYPESGMIMAYDTEKLRVAYFFLKRMDRVHVLEEPWQFEPSHSNVASDCFNIVKNKQVLVDLTLGVSAYNDLIERNPAARQFTRKGSKENTYAFSGRVNHEFMGLTQFILANWRHVTIHAPATLRETMVREAKQLMEQLSGA
ncbi:helix-turn-helix transcriptional regulator [Neolewinella antarctica]|uniref:DNA-binding transcriptional regulator YafY/biotin operon repressor n=1 Tax=Neolewinella antarctica TaxID=442734 RepID=A0ABX0X9J6_9BACT|nr:WYL domain-containing protein [Neolewinella antarctica]NJC25685.1 putative DNA-binding transcriptional regulator YafY/biotin operon repressor [Neolewinella antarctica]